MELQCKLGPRSSLLQLADGTTTAEALHAAIRAAFALDADAPLKVLCKGKALASSGELSLASGSKLMVMTSKSTERTAVDEAPRERMRGFEEDDERLRTGGVGGGSASAAAYRTRPSGPKFTFGRLEALSGAMSPLYSCGAARSPRLSPRARRRAFYTI